MVEQVRKQLNTPAAIVVAAWALVATISAVAFAGNGISGYGLAPASFWDASAIVSPAASGGTIDYRNDKQLFDLDDTTKQWGLCRGVASVGYDGTSNFTLEVHWTAETATSNAAAIFYSFERAAENDLNLDGNSFGTETSVSTTTNGASGKLNVSSFTVTNALADGLQPGDGFVLKVGRDPAETLGETDDMTDDAEIFKAIINWSP